MSKLSCCCRRALVAKVVGTQISLHLRLGCDGCTHMVAIYVTVAAPAIAAIRLWPGEHLASACPKLAPACVVCTSGGCRVCGHLTSCLHLQHCMLQGQWCLCAGAVAFVLPGREAHHARQRLRGCGTPHPCSRRSHAGGPSPTRHARYGKTM